MKTITIDSIAKEFTGKKVLNGVSLTFETGRRYALLGENGAGKSTLSHIISGSLQSDSGSISINGSPVVFADPKAAQKAGIAMVHQIPSLAEHLTVLENIILGSEPSFFLGIINKKTAEAKIQHLMDQWHITLDVSAPVANLTSQQRFHTALLAALYKSPWLLILDEPSANLGEKERDTLYKTLAKRTSESTSPLSVLFITHNISEALSHSDETIVLRKGIITACFTKDDPRATEENLTRAIFGDAGDMKQGIKPLEIRTQDELAETDLGSTKVPLFQLENLSVQPDDSPNLYNISLTVPQGSFTAVAGLKESGLSTLENLLTGFCTSPAAGSLNFLGTSYPVLTTEQLRFHGVGIVSSDKRYRSSNPDITVKDLLVSHWGHEADILASAGIKATLNDRVATLSGGMLQKLILSRELAHNPRALILANPSYGLDAASIKALKETLLAANRAGITIVVLTVVQDDLYYAATDRYQLTSGELAHETVIGNQL